MIEIPLTQGKVALIDDIDGDLAEFKWCAALNKKQFYVTRRIGTRNVFIHRIILSRILGRELLTNNQCDHINGNGLDNRRDNLRICTNAENNRNKGIISTNKSGFKGVSWYKKGQKWNAKIIVNRKYISLGNYDTPEEAYEAYCNAAKKYFGEFARLE